MTTAQERELIEDLVNAFKGKIDGGGKNIVCDCPFCGKVGKFGIYIGKEAGRKVKFSSNCFSCQTRAKDLFHPLNQIGRLDLLPNDSVREIEVVEIDVLDDVVEIDYNLEEVTLPDGYIRVFENDYLLNERLLDDYSLEYFEFGISHSFKFKNYIIIPVIEEEVCVGYVCRHIWDKKKLTRQNKQAKKEGGYVIPRYKNSTENDFINLLYNIDNVQENSLVIVVEGIFDVVALTEKLDLYDSDTCCVVATFGKKISEAQILKLQEKDVSDILLMYDPDAVEEIKMVSSQLDKYFNCMIVDIIFEKKDADDLSGKELLSIFAENLVSVVDYSLDKLETFEL